MRALQVAFLHFADDQDQGDRAKVETFHLDRLMAGWKRYDHVEDEVRVLREVLSDSEKELCSTRRLSFADISEVLSTLAQEYDQGRERLSEDFLASRTSFEDHRHASMYISAETETSNARKQTGASDAGTLSSYYSTIASQAISCFRRIVKLRNTLSSSPSDIQKDIDSCGVCISTEFVNTAQRKGHCGSPLKQECAVSMPCTRNLLKARYGADFLVTKYGAKFHIATCRHVSGKTTCSRLSPDDDQTDPCQHCLLGLYRAWAKEGFAQVTIIKAA